MKLVELPKGGMGWSRRDGLWVLDSEANTIKRLDSESCQLCQMLGELTVGFATWKLELTLTRIKNAGLSLKKKYKFHSTHCLLAGTA